MNISITQTDTIEIRGFERLDPVTCFIQDYGMGRGRLTVRCFDGAWTAYWGAMGSPDIKVREFILSASPGYVANCLVRGNRGVITQERVIANEEKYLERIEQAIRAALGAGDTGPMQNELEATNRELQAEVNRLVAQRDATASTNELDDALGRLREAQRKLAQAELHNVRVVSAYGQAAAERDRLLAEINSPELHDFAAGVVKEAVHQRERWGTDHDEGKDPADWLWLIGHLVGKALTAVMTGNRDKGLHHCISSAAVLANWHANIMGDSTRFRPGIVDPDKKD